MRSVFRQVQADTVLLYEICGLRIKNLEKKEKEEIPSPHSFLDKRVICAAIRILAAGGFLIASSLVFHSLYLKDYTADLGKRKFLFDIVMRVGGCVVTAFLFLKMIVYSQREEKQLETIENLKKAKSKGAVSLSLLTEASQVFSQQEEISQKLNVLHK